MNCIPSGKPAERPSTITFGRPVLPPLVQAFQLLAIGAATTAASVSGVPYSVSLKNTAGRINARIASRSASGSFGESGAGVAPQQ